MSKKIFLLCLAFGIALTPAPASAEYVALNSPNEPKMMLQGNLAVILVNGMGLESELPTAPVTNDYTNLLDKKGVRPLSGWDARRELTTGDLAVVLTYAIGADKKLISPLEIIDENISYIQKMWNAQYKQDGYRENLEKLLQDARFFPDGPPTDPYGYRYTDLDGDYVVDSVPATYSPGELHPTVKYIYTLKRMGVDIDAEPGRVVTDKVLKQALQSPVFRSALPNEFVDVPLTKEEKAQAEAYVIPITPGGS